MDQPKNYDPLEGLSIVGIVLSDALPDAAYHPDFLRRMREEGYETLVPPNKTQKTEEKK